MSSSSSSNSLPLPRNLGDLPAELKARIVELCAEQDERFREWVKTQASRGEPVKHSGTCPRGAVLSYSIVDLRFKCAVALRRFHLFRELHVDYLLGNGTTDLLPYLPHLHNVRKLVASQYALYESWDEDSVTLDWNPQQAPAVQYAAASFRRLRTLVELEAKALDREYDGPRAFLPFVQNNYSTLRRLVLSFTEPSAVDLGLVDILAAASGLEDLSISSEDDIFEGDPFDLSTVQRDLKTVPPLKRLTISSLFLHASHLALPCVFSDTLEHFSLTCDAVDEGFVGLQQPVFSTESLPHLTHFAMSGDICLLHSTLFSLHPSHFPGLTHLELDLYDIDDWVEDDEKPLKHFEPFPHLERVTLKRLDMHDDETVATLRRVAERNNWIFVAIGDSASSPYVAPLDVPYSYVGGLASGIRTTLEHVRREVDEAEREGDRAKLRQLEAKLAPLEAERVADAAWARA
ncbi:hypothetical protein JCM8097_000807 [Rhodosporidiobolus ruineniae]